jgi:soluble lytic murein transglycosylase-like protein
LIEQLNGWVPRRREIDDYLHTVEQLLDGVGRAEHARGKLPKAYFEVYDALLRATAWQESCWRQYVERQGAVETLRSPSGSVGLMQINTHVWRGVYDLDALLANIGYNARAGSEILVHYLVDYAIRKLEAEADDNQDSIARATYAVYNGGPRHLTRFRNPKTSAALKKIDNAFWQKYRAMQTEGPLAVKRCLAG